MGAPEYDPFAEVSAPTEPPPHPVAALQEMAELLELVHYWRTEAERLAHDYEWLSGKKRRAYLAKKAAR